MTLEIVFFQGYSSPCSKDQIVDVHIVDERGRTQMVFPAPAVEIKGRHRETLSSRMDKAQDWIDERG